ncbi:glycoside hydrolase family 3 C-terminal domain-containing protein [Photobacterium sp. ZSDE20]|uniref:beta-glucosidase n=1 Tax=Photobacterium pectinilyticum TaxID=2906793 RepID=A0ABT1N565_9GAMM|nr:glycoside hydrolase family 3 N-terminal domain-containing protein [Photobacterium sp. ZSDE20]MCQ1059702.1 glycoside hydrolase family 3 C-terminal domain-containing protein [Photobacterium sp. ZSDE20]MDD1825868.1 glycoside hydrolase family 3 C-terminal domain-containing protein [Photobacterium sp. ZSDE20]
MKNKLFTLAPVAVALILAGCNSSSSSNDGKDDLIQPVVQSRVHDLLDIDGYQFRDANGDGELAPYEDWRLTSEERAADLVSRMTLEEKVGMMLIDTLNAEAYGYIGSQHQDFVNRQKMNRFIFRNNILTQEEIDALTDEERQDGGAAGGPGGPNYVISPMEAAQYMNTMQEMTERTRLGIPALFKSNARNHIDPNAKAGINVDSGAFSAWPKEGGLAATGDMELIAEFGEVMRAEWNAIGLRGMYGYMADLATEPRWYRVHETFTEDADLASDIMTTLVGNLQGKDVSSDSIVLTMKHFPGGGPQFLGSDPHYIAGQHQSYPAGNFDYHVKPFKAAINAGVAAMMPYYGIVGGGEWSINNPDETNLDAGGVPLGDLLHDRVKDTVRVPNNDYSTSVGTPAGNVGVAFSKGILDGLLRKELGFSGVINSDTGIINDQNDVHTDYEMMHNNRAWGLQDKDKTEQFVIAIEAGTDVFSGFNRNDEIRSVVEQGLVSEERIDESVKRLLTVQFDLGLFENAYVDAEKANAIVGNADFQEKAQLAQRKAVALLDNAGGTLPLPKASSLFTMGLDGEIADEYGFDVTVGDDEDGNKVADATESDHALIRVRVDNIPAVISGDIPNNRALAFGGADFDELSVLDFTGMAESNSWVITPSLEDIQEVMDEVGAENTVLSVYFRQPYVLDDASGLKNAGAILATFGSDDRAVMDVVSGEFNPQGKLPFALANSAQAIIDQHSDAPGYKDGDTLYKFGHGLSYK